MKSALLKLSSVFFLFSLFAVSFTACKKDSKEILPDESVRLNRTQGDLFVGESVLLMPTFIPAENNPSGNYVWKVENTSLADIAVMENFSAKVTAKKTGETRVILQTTSGKEVASCDLTISEVPDPVVTLNITSQTLTEGDEITIVPVFDPVVTNPSEKYEWKVEDDQVVEMTVNSNFSVLIKGLSEGETTVSVVKKDGGKELATATLKVEPKLPAGTLVNPIQLSFGKADGVPSSWNVFTLAQGTNVGSSIPDMKDKEGNKTGVSVTLLERFNGINENGPAESNTILDMPSSVSLNSLFGNNGASFGGMVIKQSVVKFEGLNKDFEYDFCFFSSRMGVGDNRESKYIVTGSNEVIATLNSSNNTSNTVCAEKVKPDEDGTIKLTITKGENNNNGNGFFYISALRIAQVQ